MIRRRVRDHPLLEFAAATLAGLALTFVAFGPGLGARAEALLLVGEHPVVQATYRYQWIHAANDTPENGGGADHDLQIASVRLRAPLGRGFGIGVDGDLFLRKSHYGNPLLVEGDDRVPQVRAYATWRLGGF